MHVLNVIVIVVTAALC